MKSLTFPIPYITRAMASLVLYSHEVGGMGRNHNNTAPQFCLLAGWCQRKNIPLSIMDFLMWLLLWCPCLYPAVCWIHFLLCLLLCFKKQNEKAASTVQLGHNSGSYTPNMKGCCHAKMDVQYIRNKGSNTDCTLERIITNQCNQCRKLPSWTHCPGQCHSEKRTLLLWGA